MVSRLLGPLQWPTKERQPTYWVLFERRAGSYADHSERKSLLLQESANEFLLR